MLNRVLIAGCGDLGTALGLRLAARGSTVFGLRRQTSFLPSVIRPLEADLTSAADLAAVLPEELDSVVYLATPGVFTDKAYHHAYVEGLGTLLQVLADGSHPVQRLVFVSSTSVYGDCGGDWVNEETPAEPAGFSGRRLLEAEDTLRQAPWPGVVVRFAGIYGPGRERMLRRVREGRPVVADPPRYTNRIHRDDCVGVLEHLLTLDDPAPLYLGVDNAPCPVHELADWLADHLGLPRPPREQGPATDLRGSNKRCSNRRLRASGYRFLYPSFREGYAAMLDK